MKTKHKTIATLGPILILSTIFILSLRACDANADQHAVFSRDNPANKMRLFVTESAISEYTRFSFDQHKDNAAWLSGGIETKVTVEGWRRIALDGAHQFVNVQSHDEPSENMRGFRTSLGLRFISNGPRFNFELMGGAIYARYDYQNGGSVTGLAGTGSYYGVGFHRFIANKMIVSGSLQQIRQNLNAESRKIGFDIVDGIGYGLKLGIGFVL